MKQTFLVLMLVLLVALVTACGTEVPAPVDEHEVIGLQITPAAQPAASAVQACAAEIDTVIFRIVVRYPSETDSGLLIRLGEPTEGAGFMAQIAMEQLGVVLHPDNPAGSLATEEIRGVFSGRTANWADLGGDDFPVKAWVPLAGGEVRQAFEDEVMSGLPLAADAGLAPDAAAVVQAVTADPGAVGVIPAAWPHEGVRMILPGVRLPVLVVMDAEPEGPSAALVACLQGETGQAALGAVYP